ncbi:hypothetical protein KEM52_005818, partial [Ascosphaera acerosa]
MSPTRPFSVSRSTFARQASDSTLAATYQAYETGGSHVSRPSIATIAVADLDHAIWEKGPRHSNASSITIKPSYSHRNYVGPKEKDEFEKDPDSTLVNIPIHEPAFTDVEWQYLDFDTPVPEMLATPPDHIKVPNLRKFASPKTWSYTRKMLATIISSWATCLAAGAGGSYNAPDTILTEKWGVGKVQYEFGLTIFCIGFA